MHIRPRFPRFEVVAVVVPGLLLTGAVAVSAAVPHGGPVATGTRVAVAARPTATPADALSTATGATHAPLAAVAPTPVPPPPAAPPVQAAAAIPPVPPAQSPLPGCPPPPPPPGGGPGGPPWHPDVLIPDSALPPAAPATGPDASLTAVSGKGMWVWQYSRTEGGNMQAVVDRAMAAGLQEIWVRAGDSQDGFYAADQLAALVPLAHARGLDVIAWGFPYLYDPVADAQWSAAVLNWRGPGGERVDGFSPDIEMASEGVMLSAQRVAVYLGDVRPARDGRPLVATVYPPTDTRLTDYPFSTMAPYVDAYAPMVYWECRDPGAAADEAVSRLRSMKPVTPIGQAFGMGDVGGRVDQPGPGEMNRFMGTARQDGAIGASFWVWQLMNGDEWNALTAYYYPPVLPPLPEVPLLPAVH
ncbi:MAG TPA: hypothetical protein VN193_07195 [Candidatus Angelobacter sp.]|nr:hypothetical protein [Candidatus Angelobacter sp.]